MNLILNEWVVGKYTILEMDNDLSQKKYSKYRIDGIDYVPVPVYDFPRHIAIEAKGDFKGKKVEFI